MILVTGASGLLGASVVVSALQRGHEVVGLYHRHPFSLDGASLLGVDLNNQADIGRIFEQFRPSGVVHCAAETNVDWCQDHPQQARDINVLASERVAEFAAGRGAYFLYVSTDSVFDGTRGNYAETDSPSPPNVYADTKLEGERAVLARHDSAGIARVTIYGWNVQRKQSLAEWILEQLESGKTVSGFKDVIFCPILANDLAEVLLDMTERKLAGIYHVVGSEAVSKFEFARRVAQTFGFDPASVILGELAGAKLKAPRPKNTSLNTEKVRQALGRSLPDVDSGLRRFAELRREGYVERMRQAAGARQ